MTRKRAITAVLALCLGAGAAASPLTQSSPRSHEVRSVDHRADRMPVARLAEASNSARVSAASATAKVWIATAATSLRLPAILATDELINGQSAGHPAAQLSFPSVGRAPPVL